MDRWHGSGIGRMGRGRECGPLCMLCSQVPRLPSFAFEPSVFNLEILARNIVLNGLTDFVTIIPLPLSDRLAVSKLNMSTTEWGGSLSTFGQTYGHDGAPIRKIFEVPMIGLSMVDAVSLLRIAQPDYIKMDVDGIEHLILQGGGPILRGIKSASIEINDEFRDQASSASQCLMAAGLTLKQKRHAEYFDAQTGPARHTYNQVWTRVSQTEFADTKRQG